MPHAPLHIILWAHSNEFYRRFASEGLKNLRNVQLGVLIAEICRNQPSEMPLELPKGISQMP
ncbi:hypothetical protein H097_05576 [Pseudomonas sp. FH4]|nr:hypothetical protein H097_05576 [Pseudomonas sp. FH4]